MDLDELRRTWDRFGAQDPLWAVLTAPDKKNGRWDVGEFFQAGRDEIGRVLRAVSEAVGSPPTGGRALDFGCGVGRLTQAMAEHFDHVDGVDIAPSMIERARAMNTSGASCAFHLNTSPDLAAFEDDAFDFIYTAHVLQHMEPQFAASYVREFVRVLRPGGVLVFQIPVAPRIGATEALPDAGFRAELRLVDPPTALAAGSTASVRVLVRNASPVDLPSAGRDGWFLVTVGNHWSRPGWSQVDDARTPLPYDLAPGEEVLAELEVTAPSVPGTHLLEVDLCQEGVTWFADRGSPVASAPVEVTGDRRPRRPWRRQRPAPGPPAGARADEAEPRMEMYGTPEPEVTEWVTSAGGSVRSVLDWDALVEQRPPPDWERRCFVVTKASGPAA